MVTHRLSIIKIGEFNNLSGYVDYVYNRIIETCDFFIFLMIYQKDELSESYIRFNIHRDIGMPYDTHYRDILYKIHYKILKTVQENFYGIEVDFEQYLPLIIYEFKSVILNKCTLTNPHFNWIDFFIHDVSTFETSSLLRRPLLYLPNICFI